MFRVEAIAACACMGVDVPVGFVLLVEVTQYLYQDKVFEDVGVVAGMKGVAITEHGRTVSWVDTRLKCAA